MMDLLKKINPYLTSLFIGLMLIVGTFTILIFHYKYDFARLFQSINIMLDYNYNIIDIASRRIISIIFIPGLIIGILQLLFNNKLMFIIPGKILSSRINISKLLSNIALIIFAILIINTLYHNFFKYSIENISFMSVIKWLLYIIITLCAICFFYKRSNLINTSQHNNVIISRHYNLINIMQLMLIFLMIMSSVFIDDGRANNIFFISLLFFNYIAFLQTSYFNPKHHFRSLLIVLLLIIFTYIFLIIHNPFLTFGDDRFMAQSTLIGIPFFDHQIGAGRFYPISRYAYNWITFTPFFQLPIFFYIENSLFIACICIFVLISYKLRKAYIANIALFSLILILISPSFFYIFSNVNTSENLVIFLLSIFVLSLFWSAKHPSYIKYIITTFPIILATYVKEPVFIISLVMGIGLLLCYRRKISKYNLILSVLLLVNVLIYILMYLKYGFTQVLHSSGYHGFSFKYIFNYPLQLLTNLVRIDSKLNNMFLISTVIALYRVYYIIIKRDLRFVYEDLLMISGLCYGVVFFLLGSDFSSLYYYTPALFLVIYSLSLYAQSFYYDYIKHYIVKWSNLLFFALFILIVSLSVIGLNRMIRYAGFIQQKRLNDHLVVKQIYNLMIPNKTKVYWFVNKSVQPSTIEFSSIEGYKFYIINNILWFELYKNNYLNFYSNQKSILVTKPKKYFVNNKYFHYVPPSSPLIIATLGGLEVDPKIDPIKTLQSSHVCSKNGRMYYLGYYVYDYGLYYLYFTPPINKSKQQIKYLHRFQPTILPHIASCF